MVSTIGIVFVRMIADTGVSFPSRSATSLPFAIAQLVFEAASVRKAMHAALADLPWEPALILGGGKAGRTMVECIAERFPNVPGCVAVPRVHAGVIGAVCLQAAGHPLPDAGSVAAVRKGERLLKCQRGPVLFCLSGGASALLGAPANPLHLHDLRQAYRALLASGLDVAGMNAIRRRITRWGGGKLVERIGNRPVLVWVISDVLSDRLADIGSGPLTPEPTSPAHALRLAKDVAGMPRDVLEFLRNPKMMASGRGRPGNPEIEHRILVSNRTAIARLADELHPFAPRILPTQTDSVEVTAQNWATVLEQGAPGIYLAGGEPTVRLPSHPGRGGRNGQLALLVAQLVHSRAAWLFLSIASDGADGNSESAGLWVDREHAVHLRPEIARAAAKFDAATLAAKYGLALHTGPSGTNVADVQIGVKGQALIRHLTAWLHDRQTKDRVAKP